MREVIAGGELEVEMCPMEPEEDGSPVLTPTLTEILGTEDPALSPARRAAWARPGTVLLMAAQYDLDNKRNKVTYSLEFVE